MTADTTHPNLTLDDSMSFILEKVPVSYQTMLASNFSVRPSLLSAAVERCRATR